MLLAVGAVALVGLVGAASFAMFGGDTGSEEQSVTTDAPIVEEPTTPVEDVAPAAELVVVDDAAELEVDAVDAEEAPAPVEDDAREQADADVDTAQVEQDAIVEEDADVEQDADSNVDEPAGNEPAVVDPDDATVTEPSDQPAADSADEADAPAPVEPAATTPAVAESAATVRNGQIYLEGAVPTQEAGDELAALAAEVLGADNVFNNYVVDPNAGDPDLGNITVEDTINFGTDSAVLLNPDNPLLGQGVALMTIRPAMTITIVGHTDSRGTEEGNEQLSLDRAEAVKAIFVERGIDPARLTTRGAGASEPIASNDTATGRSENRRIQFFLENILGTA